MDRLVIVQMETWAYEDTNKTLQFFRTHVRALSEQVFSHQCEMQQVKLKADEEKRKLEEQLQKGTIRRYIVG